MKQDKTTQDKGLHTPGEWYTVQHSDESWGIHVKGEEIPKDLQGMIIGVIGHAGLTWNTITSKANAALIASAPTLKAENEKLRSEHAELFKMVRSLKDCVKRLTQDDLTQYDRDTEAQWEGEAFELLTRINPNYYKNANE